MKCFSSCCGGGLLCLTLLAPLGGADPPDGAPSCSLLDGVEQVVSVLSDTDLEKVASYVFGEVLATGRTEFDDDEIGEATGIRLGDGDELADAVGSHLVPTYLLIDGRGRILEKLVGFKESNAVVERVLAQRGVWASLGDHHGEAPAVRK